MASSNQDSNTSHSDPITVTEKKSIYKYIIIPLVTFISTIIVDSTTFLAFLAKYNALVINGVTTNYGVMTQAIIISIIVLVLLLYYDM